MPSLVHPIHWPVWWSSLWHHIPGVCDAVFRSLKGSLNNICLWLNIGRASIISVKHCPVLKQSDDQKLLSIGIFAEVYLVDGRIIRKAPRSRREEDLQPIVREADIYRILGKHPRIAECLSLGRQDYVDIQYYPSGDLASYLQTNTIAPDLRSKWFQQIIKAVAMIHSRHVIHSDLALRQFFVDDDFNVRLGDFNSSQYPGHPALGYERASHCLPRDYDMPSTTLSDIFALGSTLYEFVTGVIPYHELYPVEPADVLHSSDPSAIRARIQRQHHAEFEVEVRYRQRQFPNVSQTFGGDVIMGCWKGDFATAEQALARYMAVKPNA
ncbi:kinase-like protein [Aspergillus crustosus]